jgi:hypothetical protein
MLGDDLGRDGAVTAPGSSLRLFPLPKLRGLPSLPWRELGEAYCESAYPPGLLAYFESLKPPLWL